jgi:uncharacterized DUF497 family protein
MIIMDFEWDEQKRLTNLAKHGVDFELAKGIFDAPTIEFLDQRQDYGEPRMGAYGEVSGVVLFVIYTPRDTKRRLISARRASTQEQNFYRARIAAIGEDNDG